MGSSCCNRGRGWPRRAIWTLCLGSIGSGRLYTKSGAYYGRFRTPDGRRLNRRLGVIRGRGRADGLTKSQAEVALRRLIEQESRVRTPATLERPRRVDDVTDLLRDRLAIQAARKSYLENRESLQRNHISPAIGAFRIGDVTRDDAERLARAMLRGGLSPKTVRNVMSFLYSVFVLAEERDWVTHNPVAKAARPLRRRGDATADLQFLSVRELDAVIDVIPDRAVAGKPAAVRRAGPAPPPPCDARCSA